MSSYKYSVLQKQEFPKNPQDISKAIELANNPDPKFRDTRPLMSILERATIVHERLKRHIQRRKSLVAAAEFDIIPASDDFAELASHAKFRLESIIQELYDDYTTGIMFGVSLVRIKYKDTDFGFVPIIAERYKAHQLERDEDAPIGMNILRTTEYFQFERVAIKDEERHTFIAFCDKSLEPGGILRTVVYNLYMLNLITQEWSSFLLFLKGIIQAKLIPGAQQNDKEAAVKAVQSAVEDKFTVTTDLVEFAFHKITDAASGDNFELFVTKMEEDIEIAVTGTTALASDKERNAPTVQERNEEDTAKWGRLEFENYINTQLIRYDYLMNVDKSDFEVIPPYKFKFMPKLFGDKKTNHDMIMEALDRGIKISEQEYTIKTGIQLAKEGDVIVGMTEQFARSDSGAV